MTAKAQVCQASVGVSCNEEDFPSAAQGYTFADSLRSFQESSDGSVSPQASRTIQGSTSFTEWAQVAAQGMLHPTGRNVVTIPDCTTHNFWSIATVADQFERLLRYMIVQHIEHHLHAAARARGQACC